ncbi:hypothetical protein CDAR_51351 [Caerostris darwini]|uniref:Uncharacterized protein n=1 Tax=Caerostris darwini TaxID=1538125 RepID=A0AAV4U5Y6_9ARAC|nr:hypothetical protein CDAR_51351 [Caerostris darwini]
MSITPFLAYFQPFPQHNRLHLGSFPIPPCHSQSIARANNVLHNVLVSSLEGENDIATRIDRSSSDEGLLCSQRYVIIRVLEDGTSLRTTDKGVYGGPFPTGRTDEMGNLRFFSLLLVNALIPNSRELCNFMTILPTPSDSCSNCPTTRPTVISQPAYHSHRMGSMGPKR